MQVSFYLLTNIKNPDVESPEAHRNKRDLFINFGERKHKRRVRSMENFVSLTAIDKWH